MDVAVDLREWSPTYKQYFSIVLAGDNHTQLYIPRGFGHAFVTLTYNTEVVYKVDNFYSKEHDRTIFYNDPEINIPWPYLTAILSDKDASAPLLKDSDIHFDKETWL
jgi:dTDP-4-dehydrorhamnose 3,5-epimerase